MLLERIYLFLTPSRLDGYSPSQQSGLFHVYQPAEKNISIQISAAGCLEIAVLIRVYTVKINNIQPYLSLVNQE